MNHDLTLAERQLDHGEFIDVVEMTSKNLMKYVQEGKVSDVKTQIGAFWLDKILRGEWN